MPRWLLLTLLAAALVGSGWLLGRLDEPEPAPRRVVRHEPDYYLERFTELALGADGTPARRLQAARMVHYPDDDSSELAHPRLELYNAESEPWQVVAERGWVGESGEIVLLYGAVEIWRNDPHGGREIEVLTRDLRVLPEEQYAESDSPTTIRNRTTSTRGVGMRADLAAGRLELLSTVRSRHDVRSDS